MGSISFQVIGDASVGTKTKTFTVADADINRLVEWAKSRRLPDSPVPTTAEALLWWAQSMMDSTKQQVVSHEKAAAAIDFNAT